MFARGRALMVLLMFIIGLNSCTDDPVSPPQKGSIQGKVLNARDNTPIAQVSITSKPATSAVLTNDLGQFLLQLLDAAEYTITASKTGFTSGSVKVMVKDDQIVTADILLNPSSLNKSPNAPTQPSPANGSEGISVNVKLQWNADDPDKSDTLSYDVYLSDGASLIGIYKENLNTNALELSRLKYNTTYYWQIVVKDDKGAITNGTVWSFRTEPLPNNRIVYASELNGNYDIYSCGEDGQRMIQLSFSSARDWNPKISPDGNRIAFVSDRSIEMHLYTMRRDGSETTKITTVPLAGYNNYGFGFCWSPDGRQIIYPHNNTIYRINADGTNLVALAQLTTHQHFKELAWSPLGDKIVAVLSNADYYATEIVLLNVDGTSMKTMVPDQPGALSHPSFSPDGKRLIYSRDVSGHEVASHRQLDAKIFLQHVDSTHTTDLSKEKKQGTNDLDPEWSPDGGSIIFTNRANDNASPPEVWIMDRYGNDRKKIVSNGMMADWR